MAVVSVYSIYIYIYRKIKLEEGAKKIYDVKGIIQYAKSP